MLAVHAERSLETEKTQTYREYDFDSVSYYPSLMPLSFMVCRSPYPTRPAVIHGDRIFTYAEFYARCRRLASALRQRGIGLGDAVAIIVPNTPAVLKAHYGVSMAGPVLNTLNFLP